MWRNTYDVIYISSGKDTENWIICLHLLYCNTWTATGSENCGELGHTENTYPGNKRYVWSISQAQVWIAFKTKHMHDVLTYTSCAGQDLWGSELVCAGQVKHGVVTKAQLGCCTLTVGSRGVQPNKYSLTPVGYRYVKLAGLLGEEGRGGWAERSDFYSWWGFPLWVYLE